MIDRGITRRYVRALFDLSVEGKAEKKVHHDLLSFAGMLDEEPNLLAILEDPRIPAAGKKEALQKALPEDYRPLSKDFLLMIVERGRAEMLPQVADEYRELLNQHEAIVEVEVTSADRLESATKKDLTEKLEKLTGKTVKLVAHVDGELLGGLKIRVGSTLYDGSLRRSLEDLRGDLKRAALPALNALELSLGKASQADAEDSGAVDSKE